MDELEEAIGKGKTQHLLMALTLDDGYLDNLQNAHPVFDSLDVPYCVYLATGFLDGQSFPWWYLLEQVLAQTDTIELPDGAVVKVPTVEEKNNLFLQLRKYFISSADDYRLSMSWLTRLGPARPSELGQRIFLDWDEVRQISNSTLGTIGAHTHTRTYRWP